MSYDVLPKPSVGDAITKEWADQASDNDADLNARLANVEGASHPNGSFEEDDGTDPNSWTKTTAGGATGTLETTSVRHGRQGVNGAVSSSGDSVYWETTTPIPCSPGQRIFVNWDMIASAAGVQVDVDVYWWYWTGAAYSAADTASTSLYSSNSNSTSWDHRYETALPPDGTNDGLYYTVRLTVAYDSTAANVTFDGLQTGEFHGMVYIDSEAISGSSTRTVSAKNGERIRAAKVVAVLQANASSSTTWNVDGIGSTIDVADFTLPAGTWQIAEFLIPLNASRQFSVSVTGGGAQSDVWTCVGYEV